MIGELTVNSIAAKAELPINSQIVEVGGRKVVTWQDVNMALVAETGNDAVTIKTKSFESQYIKPTTLNIANWQYQPEKMTAMHSLGIMPYVPKGTCVIGQVAKNSPAELGGLLPGDKLLALNGSLVQPRCENFTDKIQALANADIELKVERKGLEKTLAIQLANKVKDNQTIGYLGIGRVRDEWPEQYRFDLTYGFLDSFDKGIEKTWDVTGIIF